MVQRTSLAFRGQPCHMTCVSLPLIGCLFPGWQHLARQGGEGQQLPWCVSSSCCCSEECWHFFCGGTVTRIQTDRHRHKSHFRLRSDDKSHSPRENKTLVVAALRDKKKQPTKKTATQLVSSHVRSDSHEGWQAEVCARWQNNCHVYSSLFLGLSPPFDLNWTLGSSSFQEAQAQQQRREAARALGCHLKKKKRSKIRLCYSEVSERRSGETDQRFLVLWAVWPYTGTMWRVNCSLAKEKKYLKMDIQLWRGSTVFTLPPAGPHLILYKH